jgi:hypothetical protein
MDKAEADWLRLIGVWGSRRTASKGKEASEKHAHVPFQISVLFRA